jgi:hypothetical protein
MVSKVQTFGTLFRYECKALLRILPVLYLASLVLSAVAGFRSRENDFFVSIWMTMNSALFVVTLVLVILRFRNNFLKDEGYLMFTLPVPLWQLVVSKALAALCAFVATCVVTVLSTQILFSLSGSSTVADSLAVISSALKSEYGDWILPCVVLFVLFIVQQLFLIYACLTASQIAPRFRGLIGFAAYMAVMLLVEYPLSSRVFNALPEETLKLGIIWIAALMMAVFAAVCFIASVKLLKHTFNLE